MIAVITGGARGIGRALAKDLIARGYDVVIGDLDLAVTDATARELGDHATAIRLDVTDRTLIAETIAHVESTLGPIELWINNAGIMPTGRFSDQSIELSRAIIEIDYVSVVEATRAILPVMLARGHGTIVNMASATGMKPLAGLAAYSGAKAAVIGFSAALHRELRRTGVRIMVVSPNMVRTAMGAGITPPAISGSISAAAVSKATLRGLDRGRFHVIVPRRFALILRLFTNLPLSWQDWIDDRANSDRIGLGGDPAERAKYLAGVLPTAKR